MKIVSLSYLAEKSGIHKMRLWANISGERDTLTQDEKTHIANVLFKESSQVFNALGFSIGKMKRLKDQE